MNQTTWTQTMAKWLAEEGARFEVSLALFPGRVHFGDDWTALFHSSTQHLLYFPIEGALEACVNDQQHVVNAGDLFWAARGMAFSFRRCGENPLVVNRFRLEATDKNNAPLECCAPFLHLSPARSRPVDGANRG